MHARTRSRLTRRFFAHACKHHNHVHMCTHDTPTCACTPTRKLACTPTLPHERARAHTAAVLQYGWTTRCIHSHTPTRTHTCTHFVHTLQRCCNGWTTRSTHRQSSWAISTCSSRHQTLQTHQTHQTRLCQDSHTSESTSCSARLGLCLRTKLSMALIRERVPLR